MRTTKRKSTEYYAGARPVPAVRARERESVARSTHKSHRVNRPADSCHRSTLRSTRQTTKSASSLGSHHIRSRHFSDIHFSPSGRVNLVNVVRNVARVILTGFSNFFSNIWTNVAAAPRGNRKKEEPRERKLRKI